ncbi:MAG: GTPase ObgE [Desulfosarcinaceae bacterium]|nr:GTPase ObgE [Desulfosarcinaceae bacterium]
MKFIDEAKITIESGSGGKGCVSFRRERFIPKGGPDGGDGGRGADVVFLATQRRRTLQQFRFKREFKAPGGGAGQGSQKSGRSGRDLVIEVPPGTLIRDAESGALLSDLATSGTRFTAARGGRGGRGNARFKTSTNRAPRHAQPGEPGVRLCLHLELKLLADVGLVGLPNAGKSTLMRALSAATPKVGAYPFTTLTPHLGVVQTDWGEPFVVADIPGLIEGAHKGAGLGTRFLKHVERTRVLVHLLDAAGIAPSDPLKDYHLINAELSAHNADLGAKPQVVVLNKMDLADAAVGARHFQAAAEALDLSVVTISAREGRGLEPLISHLLRLLTQA